MSSHTPLKVPFLPTSRRYPKNEIPELAQEMDKSYIDIANAVNNRVIGFHTNDQTNAGQTWILDEFGRPIQILRKVISISGTGNFPHGINFNSTRGFTDIHGTFTDGTNWYAFNTNDVTAVNNQVSMRLDPTNVIITAGGGSPPTVSSGWVVLEWLAQV